MWWLSLFCAIVIIVRKGITGDKTGIDGRPSNHIIIFEEKRRDVRFVSVEKREILNFKKNVKLAIKPRMSNIKR